MEIKAKVREAIKAFGMVGEVACIDTIRVGHINGTYSVTMRDGRVYFVQPLNTYVFKHPRWIMQNIAGVTAHIAKKLEALGESRDGVMHFVTRENGENFYEDENGFWRISEGVPNALTISEVREASVLRSAGEGFGRFQNFLADYDASTLHETIKDFHNTAKRIEAFNEHVAEDSLGRVKEAAYEIAKIRELTPLATKLCRMLEAGELPLRVTHNDTKINNIIFDKDTKAAKTVIDLDTVMPGLVAYDFGDAIRFAANTAKEDEADLSRVGLNIEYYRAFAEGFIGQVHSALTKAELDTLALGAFTMTLELVVRFLDDYLTGDQYFSTSYPGHNLVRARCQLRLAEDMVARMDEMNAIVAEVAAAL